MPKAGWALMGLCVRVLSPSNAGVYPFYLRGFVARGGGPKRKRRSGAKRRRSCTGIKENFYDT